MPEFLRQPKNGQVQDGDTFVDVQSGEVIAQKAKLVGGKVKCLEVRTSLTDAKGNKLSKEKRDKAIESAKESVEKLYNK